MKVVSVLLMFFLIFKMNILLYVLLIDIYLIEKRKTVKFSPLIQYTSNTNMIQQQIVGNL